MPKLHVIYDPGDRLSHDADMNKSIGLKVAIMSVSDTASDEDLKELTKKLAHELLFAFHEDKR